MCCRTNVSPLLLVQLALGIKHWALGIGHWRGHELRHEPHTINNIWTTGPTPTMGNLAHRAPSQYYSRSLSILPRPLRTRSARSRSPAFRLRPEMKSPLPPSLADFNRAASSASRSALSRSAMAANLFSRSASSCEASNCMAASFLARSVSSSLPDVSCCVTLLPFEVSGLLLRGGRPLL